MFLGQWGVLKRGMVLAAAVIGVGALAAPDVAWANGLGISRVRDDLSPTKLNLRGSRVDITTPGSFNIQNPNFGLERVVAQKGFTGGSLGLIQVGIGQFNGVGLDQCIGPNNAGQLKQYWERKSYPSGSFICGFIQNIGSSTHLYKIQREFCFGSSQCWAPTIDTVDQDSSTDIGFDTANEVDIGGEIATNNTCCFNGNTSITSFFGENTGSGNWQRTSDLSGGATWTTITTRNDTQNDGGRWHLPDAATPTTICWINNTDCNF